MFVLGIVFNLIVFGILLLPLLNGGPNASDVAFGMIVLQIIVGLFSFGKMTIDEVGYLSFLGRPLVKLEAGPYYKIPFLMEAFKLSGATFQDELPAEPEKIFRRDDKEAIPPGLFPPIRIKFGPPDPKDADLVGNPYNKEMTVEVPVVVSWHIEDIIIFHSTAKTVDNMRKIMEDKAISLFNEEFANMTPAKASRVLKEIGDRLKIKLQNETSDKGIEIEDAYVKPFVYSHDLNKTVTQVSEEEQRAQMTLIKAAAEKKKRTDEGAGAAEARRLLLEAEAAGTKNLAELAKTDEGRIVLYMETLKTALEKAQYSIIPGSEAYNALSGMMETFKRIGGKP